VLNSTKSPNVTNIRTKSKTLQKVVRLVHALEDSSRKFRNSGTPEYPHLECYIYEYSTLSVPLRNFPIRVVLV